MGDAGAESGTPSPAEVELSDAAARTATPRMTITTSTTYSTTTSTPSTTLGDAHLEAVKVHMTTTVKKAREQNSAGQ